MGTNGKTRMLATKMKRWLKLDLRKHEGKGSLGFHSQQTLIYCDKSGSAKSIRPSVNCDYIHVIAFESVTLLVL